MWQKVTERREETRDVVVSEEIPGRRRGYENVTIDKIQFSMRWCLGEVLSCGFIFKTFVVPII